MSACCPTCGRPTRKLLDDLAEEYGLARVTIQAVIAKRNWKEVA